MILVFCGRFRQHPHPPPHPHTPTPHTPTPPHPHTHTPPHPHTPTPTHPHSHTPTHPHTHTHTHTHAHTHTHIHTKYQCSPFANSRRNSTNVRPPPVGWLFSCAASRKTTPPSEACLGIWRAGPSSMVSALLLCRSGVPWHRSAVWGPGLLACSVLCLQLREQTADSIHPTPYG